jgi:hypothetical protein
MSAVVRTGVINSLLSANQRFHSAMLRIVATNPSQIVLRYMEWASEGFAHRFTAEGDEIAISNSSS